MECFGLTWTSSDFDYALCRIVYHTLKRLELVEKFENIYFSQNLLLFSNFDLKTKRVGVLQHFLFLMLIRCKK